MTAAVTDRPTAPLAAGRARRARALDEAWAVGIVGAIGLIVTIGLWVRHGEVAAASGPGGLATAIGQVTALVGTYLVLAQLLLMSRISWLERAIGLDRLAQWHRWNGFALVWLLVGHVVFTTLGWAQADARSLWWQTNDFIQHYPDILMAWVGFVMFLGVAFTSVRLARRALKREVWYFVHLYAYLAVALAFAHQLAVGTDFSGDTMARVWWVGIYVAVIAAVVWWRVLTPLLLNRRHAFLVHSVHREAPGVASIILAGKRLDTLQVQPGQFFLWRFKFRNAWWQAHPFSISAVPTKNRMRITVKALGDESARLQRVKRGTRVFAEGPYGTFTADRRSERRVLLVAGGIGITPLRAMLEAFTPDDDVVLLYRVAKPDDAVFVEELKKFAAQANITIHMITGTEIGDDNTDRLGLPALRKGVPDIAARECYVCGPPALTDAVCRRLHKLGVPRHLVHYERFEF